VLNDGNKPENGNSPVGNYFCKSVAHAVVNAELAVLLPGGCPTGRYLEHNLPRKIIYRRVICAYARDTEICTADLVSHTGQSRQNVRNQIGDMVRMDLLSLEQGSDRRTRIIRPTQKLLEYWQYHCDRLLDMPEMEEMAEAVQNRRQNGNANG